MSKEAAAVLRAARKMIEKPECWTQGHFARTAKGHPIGPNQDNAVCWCMSGAIRAVTGHDLTASWAAESYIERTFRFVQSVAEWNDLHNRSHKTVLRAFDRAIKLAEAEQ